jgi:hypothetical protein
MQRDDRTFDLLSWTPPVPVRAFEPEVIRAASIKAALAKAVSAALRDCGRPREELAAEMSAYLGEEVTRNMLDAYASEAREEHVITIPRLKALAHVTGDAQRLLQFLAADFGLIVVDRRYEAAINAALINDKIEELNQRLALEKRAMKGARS